MNGSHFQFGEIEEEKKSKGFSCKIEDIEVKFPYSPYSVQKEFMTNIMKGIK